MFACNEQLRVMLLNRSADTDNGGEATVGKALERAREALGERQLDVLLRLISSRRRSLPLQACRAPELELRSLKPRRPLRRAYLSVYSSLDIYCVPDAAEMA
jgi:hypothetical protein